MPLLRGTIRPVPLTPARVRTATARTIRALDAWTLQTFNPPVARRDANRTTRVG